jgi:FK506-binding nuclear protein
MSGFEFWSDEVKSGKTLSVTVPGDNLLHISGVALGEKIVENKKRNHVYVKVGEKKRALICTLRENSIEQATLDLVIPESSTVQFSTNTKNTVCISGFLQPVEEEDMMDSEDEQHEHDILTERAVSLDLDRSNAKKRKAATADAPKKANTKRQKTVQKQPVQEESSSESDSDEVDGASVNALLTKLRNQQAAEESESDSESDEDMPATNGAPDSESESEEEPAPQPKKAKVQTPAQKKKKKAETPASKRAAFVATPAAKKEKVVPQTEPKKKTADGNKNQKVAPQSAKKAKADKKYQTFKGVSFRDKKIGNGKAVKVGNTLRMRYVGMLTKNKAVFDSNLKGSPFSFKLGKGEVIKGWDFGLQGMRVGGKRELKIPARLGYGKRGTDGIPGNSDLTFVVEVLGA